MSTITSNSVNLSQNWGPVFCDYTIDKGTTGEKNVDFQDLMVAVSEKRAVAVEGEVTPLTTHIKMRNKQLDTLGSILAAFTQLQANYASDAAGSDEEAMGDVFQEEWIPLASEAYRRKGGTPHSDLGWWKGKWSKSSVEGMVSELKSMIDSRNNAAQSDMSRLQSLVDRRDESYSTATNLMSAISDSRANLIHNF